jgi:hypothetical protein
MSNSDAKGTSRTGADSTFFNALCIRYLAGILQLAEVGFWLKIGNVHGDIARKLCLKTLQVLEDISLDILPSEPSPTPESPFDYEGVDLLAETVLVGISSWFRTIDATDWALQPWYAVFRKVVHLLRRYLRTTFFFDILCMTSFSGHCPQPFCQVLFLAPPATP